MLGSRPMKRNKKCIEWQFLFIFSIGKRNVASEHWSRRRREEAAHRHHRGIQKGSRGKWPLIEYKVYQQATGTRILLVYVGSIQWSNWLHKCNEEYRGRNRHLKKAGLASRNIVHLRKKTFYVVLVSGSIFFFDWVNLIWFLLYM